MGTGPADGTTRPSPGPADVRHHRRALCVHGVRAQDRGAVTAELAVALPAVVLVLAAVLLTGAAAGAQLRCADAARAGARVAALGQSDADVAAVAARVAGAPVDVAVRRSPPWVQVAVSTRVAGTWFTGGPLGLSATATAWLEP